MKTININRKAGKHIIVATKDGKESYFNWYVDGLTSNKECAAWYNSERNATDAMNRIKDLFDGYTWKTELDIPV